MVNINSDFQRLEQNYLFAEVSRRVMAHKKANPDAELINLGIGDVAGPLSPVFAAALEEAAVEMATQNGFYGYGPYEGYGFLREAAAAHYKTLGAAVDAADVFISDGAKSDLGDILDLFARGSRVLIPDPVYPAYVDANTIAGNSVFFLDANAQNDFLPPPPKREYDLVYLCSPNNPTGAAYSRAALKQWVDYANGCGAVLLFDAAYERFVREGGVARSIYEVPGAERCAIEFFSLSKTAGFTGLRCGWCVIPRALERGGRSLRELWALRAAIRYNGTSYVIQRAAAAAFTPAGAAACGEMVARCLENAALLRAALERSSLRCFGGQNAPYVWFECPGRCDSWRAFALFLNRGVVVTPGVGFGKNGGGFCRLSAFNTAEATAAAAKRLASAAANDFN